MFLVANDEHGAEYALRQGGRAIAVEENLKVFSERLAASEQDYPNLYYQDQSYRLRCAIAELKKVRDTLGALNWI